MKIKSLLTAAIIAVFFILSGCTALQSVGNSLADVANENPAFANLGTRAAVDFYIQKKDTLQGRIDRAKDVERRLNVVLLYLEDNPSATTDAIMQVIDKNIDWDDLSPSDRAIVGELVELIRIELKAYEERLAVPSDTRIAIRSLLEVAISAARFYLLAA